MCWNVILIIRREKNRHVLVYQSLVYKSFLMIEIMSLKTKTNEVK